METERGTAQHRVTIEVDDGGEISMMAAYRLSSHLCLLRFDRRKRDITSFVKFAGIFLLVHTPTGKWVGWVKGKKDELLQMAAQLEEVNDLAVSDLDQLTDEQRQVNEDIAKNYRVRIKEEGIVSVISY